MSAADWPSHDNPEWQRVLDKARAKGWPTPEWSSSHPTIHLKCPTGACSYPIFKTGAKNTDRVAIQCYRKLDRCTHGDISGPLSAVDRALDTADRLITGAEVLLARAGAQTRMEAAFADIDDAVDAAAAAIEAEFDQAEAAFTKLDEQAAELLGDDHEQLEPDAVAATAGTHLRTAKVELVDLPKKSEEANERRTRLADLMARRDEIREHRA